jgi:hypothetical protein
MNIITFQCSKCQKVLRIGAENAGKKARCSKCGQSLVIPNESQPPSNPSTPARFDPFGDEGESTYSFADDAPPDVKDNTSGKVRLQELYARDEDAVDDDEDDEEKEAKEREQQRLLGARRREALARLRKTPLDFAQWEKVRLGILLVFIGVVVWLAAVALQKVVVLIGLPYSSEYAAVAGNELVNRAEPIEPGKAPTLYRARFLIGLIGGQDLVDLNLWLYRLSYLLVLIQLVCTGTGYVICLAAPTRYGARGLIVALLPMVGFSFVLTLGLKLLPISGAYLYTMIPLIAPETALLRSNIDRSIPIHLFWSGAPFWESLLSILLHLATFGELVLFCIFLRAAALNLKDEPLQHSADPLIKLGLAIGFILVSFHLLINTGTTEVLINILWGVYWFAFAFYLWFLIWYLRSLHFARARIAKIIRMYGGDLEMDEDEDVEEDEDEDDSDEDDDED